MVVLISQECLFVMLSLIVNQVESKLGDPCVEGLSNCGSGYVCQYGTCLCSNTHYNNTGLCENKAGYGEPCFNKPCNLVNGNCYNYTGGGDTMTCRCDENFYADNNTCRSVEELQPSNVTVRDVTTKSFQIVWDEPEHHIFIIKYIVMGNNIYCHSVFNISHQYTIEQLLPDTIYYNVTVESLVKTDHGPIHVSSVPITATTKAVSLVVPITVGVVLFVFGVSMILGNYLYQRHKRKDPANFGKRESEYITERM